MIRENVKGQLYWIALWANSFADSGKTASFEEVHTHLRKGTLLTWMGDLGADMSVQLSDTQLARDVVQPALTTLAAIAGGLEGRERKKLAVSRNGFCLLVSLVLEALAIDKEYE